MYALYLAYIYVMQFGIQFELNILIEYIDWSWIDTQNILWFPISTQDHTD